MRKWLSIGLMLLVVWIAGVVVFKVVGFLFHLLLIVGLVMLGMALFRRFAGRHGPRTRV